MWLIEDILANLGQSLESYKRDTEKQAIGEVKWNHKDTLLMQRVAASFNGPQQKWWGMRSEKAIQLPPGSPLWDATLEALSQPENGLAMLENTPGGASQRQGDGQGVLTPALPVWLVQPPDTWANKALRCRRHLGRQSESPSLAVPEFPAYRNPLLAINDSCFKPQQSTTKATIHSP